MQPYRRIFDFNASFPFQSIHRDIRLTQHELPDHIHDWYELVYIYEGEGTFFIDHTLYEAEAGAIFLIPGNTIHRSFPNEANPKLSSALYFSAAFVESSSILGQFNYLHMFETAKKHQAFKLLLPDAQRILLEQHIEAIHEENLSRLLGFEQQIQHYVQQILLLLLRHMSASGQQADATISKVIPSWAVQLFTYIDDHLHIELPLHLLAKQAAVSPAHLSRLFKQITGMNVTNYVNAKKMMRAKDLLLSKDMSVYEVAEQCGFGSLTHFHRIFKRATGVSPAQFKKQG